MHGAALCAIGRLEVDGPWVGLSRDADGYRIAFGRPDASVLVTDASRPELLALAIAFFEDRLDDAPPDLEATQGDIGDVCRWLAQSESRTSIRALLQEAVDAIDDGLAMDATVLRLGDALRAQTGDEQVDVLDLLVNRYRSLTG